MSSEEPASVSASVSAECDASRKRSKTTHVAATSTAATVVLATRKAIGWAQIPRRLLGLALGGLGPRALGNAARVCGAWSAVAREARLPADRVSHWARLDNELLCLVARGLTVAERLLAFELCCADWRSASLAGCGWHTLHYSDHRGEIAWLPRLGGRLAALRRFVWGCSAPDAVAPLVRARARLETLELFGQAAVANFAALALGSCAAAIPTSALVASVGEGEGDGDADCSLLSSLRELGLTIETDSGSGEMLEAALARLGALEACALFFTPAFLPRAPNGFDEAAPLRVLAANRRVVESLRDLSCCAPSLNVEPVGAFVGLERLTLYGRRFSDAVLGELALPNLQVLRLMGARPFRSDCSFPKLTKLYWGCGTADDRWLLRLLRTSAHQLESLTIAQVAQVADEAAFAAALAETRFPRLATIYLEALEDWGAWAPGILRWVHGLLAQLDMLYFTGAWTSADVDGFCAAGAQLQRSSTTGAPTAESAPPAKRGRLRLLKMDAKATATADVIRTLLSLRDLPQRLDLVGASYEQMADVANALPDCFVMAVPSWVPSREPRLIQRALDPSVEARDEQT